MMRSKPTYEQLVAYAAGDLSADQAQEVCAYLMTDAAASSTFERVRAIVQAMRTDQSVSASADSIAAAKSIFRPLPAVEPWWKRLSEAVAEVVFDSRMQPALAGFRSSGGSGFQIALESEAASVDLQFEPQDESRSSWRIMGQVVPADGPSAEIAVLVASECDPVSETFADDSGVFTMTLDRGEYDLCVRVRDRVLRVPGIRVA